MKIIPYLTSPIQTNTYLVFDESTGKGFVVDPGGPCKALLKDIEEEHVELQYVVLTHGHGDHIGGVEEILQMYTGCKLAYGTNEVDMLNGKIDNASAEMFGRDILLNAHLLLNDNDTFEVGNMSFKILETPGHTPGGISLYTEGVVFTGDTLFRQSVGRTDFPGGDFNQLSQSIREKLYTLPDDTVVLPGHMQQSNIGFEKRNNYFV